MRKTQPTQPNRAKYENLSDLLRRCGCYVSATMNMYDCKQASKLKRDIDIALERKG